MDMVRAFQCAGNTHGFEFNIQGTSDDPLFQANHVGRLLGIRHYVSASLRDFEEDEKVSILAQTNGGKQRITFLTKKGVKRMIANSRKPVGLEMAKMLDMQIFECKVERYEASTLLDIMKAFRGKEMVLQYRVGKFQVDLYFPKYKLAVECDEKTHENKVGADAARQLYIETQLNCTFIRFKPYLASFCTPDLFNRILGHIEAYPKP